jgi:membrane-associated phospholipid phosphatase
MAATGRGAMTAKVQVSARGAPVDLTAAAVRVARRRAAEATVPFPLALARGRRGQFLAAGACLGFSLLFTLVRANRSNALDLAITTRLQRWRAPWLARTLAVISWPGFPPQSRIIPPALAAAFWLLGFPVEALFQFLAWGTALLSALIKARTHRPRPAGPAIRVIRAKLDGSSFPGGHVLSYVGVYGFLAYAIGTLVRPEWIRRPVVAGLCGLLALVGPSRIYQGHHWTTDVLASYSLGLGYLVGLAALYRRARARWG